MKQLVCLISLMVSLAGARSSSAALISLDLDVPGDGLLTRDTVERLEWLDLSQSTGYSYSQIEAGAGGFTARGFRHGNQAEVINLMAQFGFPPLPSNPAYLDAAQFISLISCTSTCAVDGRGSNGIADPVTLNPDSKIIFNLFVFLDPIPPHASITQFVVTPEHSGSTIGHYLVRTVPEPRLFALTVLLLLALALLRSVRPTMFFAFLLLPTRALS
jgi:hypothetical protein